MAKKKKTPFEQRKSLAEKAFWFSCLLFVAFIGLGIGATVGLLRFRTYQSAHGKTQILSPVDLAKRDPGLGATVQLIGFDYGKQYWPLIGKDSDGKPNSNWIHVDLAAFPKGRADDATAPLIIVRTNKVDNDEQVKKFQSKASLQGILLQCLEDCTVDQKKMLALYHRSSLGYEKVPVVDTDGTVPTFQELGIIAGVIVLSLVTLGWSGWCALATYSKLKRLTEPGYTLPACKNAIAPDESYQVGWQRCMMLLQAKRKADAIEGVAGLIVKFPTHAGPRALLAQIMPREQPEVYMIAPPYAMYTYHPDSPLALCREALAMAPDMPYVHLVHAQLLRQRGNYKQAYKAIDEALRLNAEYYEAIIEAGLIALDLGDFNRLISFCDMGLHRRPNEFAFLNNKAVALWRLRRLEEAGELFEQALAIEPNKANAHMNRGAIAKELKQNDIALEHFKIALRLNPHDTGLVEMVALAVPKQPLGLRIVRPLMIIAGAPFFLAKNLLRKYPPLNKLIWKRLIYFAVAIYPLIVLGMVLCFVPSARPIVSESFNRCHEFSPLQGQMMAFILLLAVPWIPFLCLRIVARLLEARVARAELGCRLTQI